MGHVHQCPLMAQDVNLVLKTSPAAPPPAPPTGLPQPGPAVLPQGPGVACSVLRV